MASISKLIQSNHELSRRVTALESGEAYRSMRNQMQETAAYANRRVAEEQHKAEEAVRQARSDVAYYERELRKRDTEHEENLNEVEKRHAEIENACRKEIERLNNEVSKRDSMIDNLLDEYDILNGRHMDLVGKYRALRKEKDELAARLQKYENLPSQDAVVAFYMGKYNDQNPDNADDVEHSVDDSEQPVAKADAEGDTAPIGPETIGADESASILDSNLGDAHNDEDTTVSADDRDTMHVSEEHPTEEAASDGDQQEEKAPEQDNTLDEDRSALIQKDKEIKELQAELKASKQEARALAIKVMRHELNKDSKSSNMPSSLCPFQDFTPNNRSKTGKKQGGQPDHPPTFRVRYEADREVILDPPEDVRLHPEKYVKTGNRLEHDEKELAALFINTRYVVEKYKNIETGKKIKATFPGYLQNETNYGPMLKAFMLLQKDRANVSERKIVETVADITGGKLKPSRSMINGLNAEFANKAKPELDKIFKGLLESLVMYTDTTNGKQSGKHRCVSVYRNKDTALFMWSRKGGDESAIGSPLIGYDKILVHDHAAMNYHYGRLHQECLAHIIRKLLRVMKAEPNKCWARKMRKLLRTMIHTRKEAMKKGRMLTPSQVENFRKEYDLILKVAFREYEMEPADKDFPDGYNLAVMLRDYKEAVLLFLVDPNVDPTNNGSENLCRKVKMHQAGGKQFRGDSDLAGIAYCDTQSVLETARMQGVELFEFVAEIFRREAPVSMKKTRALYKQKAVEDNKKEAEELAAREAKEAKKAKAQKAGNG